MKGRIKRETQGETTGPVLRLPEIGKLKIGEKVKAKYRSGHPKQGQEYERPVSLEHFKATGKYTAIFHEIYGEKPPKVEIVFISDNILDVCDERYEIRDGQGNLFGKGDGEVFQIWSDRAKQYQLWTLEEVPDVMEQTAEHLGTVWKKTLTIRFVIPKIRGVMGVWSLTTKGEASSIPSVRDSFDFVKEMAGTVINVPFDLTVEKRKSQKPGESRIFPVLAIVPNVSKESLETVRQFILEGRSIRELPGMLTDESIEQWVPRQLTAGNGDGSTGEADEAPGDLSRKLFDVGGMPRAASRKAERVPSAEINETIQRMIVEVELCAECRTHVDAYNCVKAVRAKYGAIIDVGWTLEDQARFKESYDEAMKAVEKVFPIASGRKPARKRGPKSSRPAKEDPPPADDAGDIPEDDEPNEPATTTPPVTGKKTLFD